MLQFYSKIKTNKKLLLPLLCLGLLFLSSDVLAAKSLTEAKTIADIANNIVSAFAAFGQLIIATAYLGGIALIISAVFKFKKHRDNPNQIPVSGPIFLFAAGIMLIFLPTIIVPAGVTIFGGSAGTLSQQAGGFEGGGAKSLPGFKSDNT